VEPVSDRTKDWATGLRNVDGRGQQPSGDECYYANSIRKWRQSQRWTLTILEEALSSKRFAARFREKQRVFPPVAARR
jgi:hypothetical protein